MNLTEMLDAIDVMLLQDDGRQLWKVLTALRGPDNEDWIAKEQTTERIRAAAFPRTAIQGTYICGAVYSLLPLITDWKPNMSFVCYPHFTDHTNDAIRALIKAQRHPWGKEDKLCKPQT